MIAMKSSLTRLALLLLSVSIGCNAADDPQVLAMREQYRLSTEPVGAIGILQVREQFLVDAGRQPASDAGTEDPAAENPAAQLSASDASPPATDEAVGAVAQDEPAETGSTPAVGPTSPEPVVLVGRIGGGANPTWEAGRAVFVMMDPSAEVGQHDHGAPGHDDNCPFCKAAKKNAVDASAFVQVVDQSGTVVAVDARKLLALQEGQLVSCRVPA